MAPTQSPLRNLVETLLGVAHPAAQNGALRRGRGSTWVHGPDPEGQDSTRMHVTIINPQALLVVLVVLHRAVLRGR